MSTHCNCYARIFVFIMIKDMDGYDSIGSMSSRSVSAETGPPKKLPQQWK